MFVGETVVVITREQTGTDPGNSPIYGDVETDVDNVLVAPGPRSDVLDSNRPAGVDVVYNLHLPKTFTGSLRRAIEIRDRRCQHPLGDGEYGVAGGGVHPDRDAPYPAEQYARFAHVRSLPSVVERVRLRVARDHSTPPHRPAQPQEPYEQPFAPEGRRGRGVRRMQESLHVR